MPAGETQVCVILKEQEADCLSLLAEIASMWPIELAVELGREEKRHTAVGTGVSATKALSYRGTLSS